MTDADRSAPGPLLAVTRGAPTPDELAALVVVLASRPAVPVSSSRARRSEWAATSRTLRAPVHAGPGAWRASALPG
jgi:acyl-CoA carboxylase epsilon subunit